MNPRRIIIHCAATPNGKAFGASDIDRWHRERGFQRTKPNRGREYLSSIGYHFVVRLNGEIELGRDKDEAGAHAADQNYDSLGICLIGTDQFTLRQWLALKVLVESLMLEFNIPVTGIFGHNQFSNKICPGFSVTQWLAGKMAPLSLHLLVDESL